jgi:hypothetical protein
MADKAYIKSRFDIRGLYKAGFLRNTVDFDYIEKRICTFFGFKDIHEYDIGLTELGLLDKPVLLKTTDITKLGDEKSRKN